IKRVSEVLSRTKASKRRTWGGQVGELCLRFVVGDCTGRDLDRSEIDLCSAILFLLPIPERKRNRPKLDVAFLAHPHHVGERFLPTPVIEIETPRLIVNFGLHPLRRSANRNRER